MCWAGVTRPYQGDGDVVGSNERKEDVEVGRGGEGTGAEEGDFERG